MATSVQFCISFYVCLWFIDVVGLACCGALSAPRIAGSAIAGLTIFATFTPRPYRAFLDGGEGKTEYRPNGQENDRNTSKQRKIRQKIDC
jgi:hypothetical protein